MAKRHIRQAHLPEPPSTLSLRTSVTGAVVEFLQKQRMSCLETQTGLVTLIDALSDYREEGEPLFPEVFVVDNLAAFLKPLPGCHAILVGTAERTSIGMRRALKKLAPLAKDGWCVYLERLDGKFNFGLFQSRPTCLSVAPGQALFRGASPVPALSIRSLGPHSVELRGTQSRSFIINFGTKEETQSSPTAAIEDMVKCLIGGIPERLQDQASNLYTGTFLSLLQGGHGTLAAIKHPRLKLIPRALRTDSVLLTEPIDIADAVGQLASSKSAEAEGKLRGFRSVLVGMLKSDGITVLSDNGHVIAYNCFVKHTDATPASGTVAGGARRRAFEVLKTMATKRLLSAAYIQSQDGETEFFGG